MGSLRMESAFGFDNNDLQEVLFFNLTCLEFVVSCYKEKTPGGRRRTRS